MKKIFIPGNSPSTILIRLIVGTVFLSEGIQKFLFPLVLGPGRFEKIGFPAPEFLAYLTGSFEILCGLMVVLGLITRLAAIPLLTIIVVALITTKVPMLVHDGFWKMMHESRADLSMFLGAIFLIIEGGGRWSLDRLIFREE